MALFSRQKVERIDRRRSLDGIPVRNDNVEVRDSDPARIEVMVRWQRGSSFLDRFRPPVMERKIRLDELGTFVFQRIDGHRTVRDLVDDFVRQYRTSRREAELSTVAFLRSLAQRQVISIVIP